MEQLKTSNSNAPVLRTSTLHIRSTYRRGGNLLLDIPIAGRLTLGFLTAALVAALITGIIGVQRSQSLNRQSDFYQNLLSTNTSLTTGANFLQLMNVESQQLVTVATSPTPSQETLNATLNATRGLENRYNTIINQYITSSLIDQHPDQANLLAEANHSIQITQQRTLAGSALRTWRVYRATQEQILRDIQANNTNAAQNLLRVQAEPTNADAQSALRSLILFDERLATSVRDAASVEEQNQIVSTLIGAVIAFILIVLIGWFISNTLIQRLRQLRQVTQAVERGQLDARVSVIGRDEIADVSASFNAMLEATVGLLDETRQQRDALTNAAEHLFTDMRVVSAGDLRINAPVSNDPIGMLANAFNFTVGRFRRFVLRTQGALEQLDVISRQELERSEAFLHALDPQLTGKQGTSLPRPLSPITEEKFAANNDNVAEQIQRLRGRIQQISRYNITSHSNAVLKLAEQSTHALQKINQTMTISATSAPAHELREELRKLERLIQSMAGELQSLQKSAARSFLDIDKDLTKLNDTARREQPISGAIGKDTGEQVRQGVIFAKEVTVMAHQLAALAQEMRIVIVSFQLDAPDAGPPRTIREESPLRRGIRFREKKMPNSGGAGIQQFSPRNMKMLSYEE